MPVISFARAIAGAVRRFPAAKEGNIAVIFTIALVPILAFIGMAIDYSRASKARSAMQAALDSAVLMISKDLTNGTIQVADVPTKAQNYFNALYNAKGREAVVVTFNATYTVANASTGSQVKLTSSGQIKTDFMKLVNFPTMDFGTSSTATWGNTRMRVALVLDNTGSMQDNGKMPAMQKAAKAMIDQLSAFNKNDGDVYISIVPFTKDVNVKTFGTSNVDAPWINWTEWEAEPPVLTQHSYPINVQFNNITYTWADIGPGAACPFDTTAVKGITRPTNNSTVNPYGFLCMDRPATVSGAADLSSFSTNRYLIPSSGPYSGMICPGIDSGVNLPGKTGVYYNGCYTSVANPAIVTNGSSASCTGKPNCTCSGSGSHKSCTQTTYSHYWRSNPSDTNQNVAAAPAHSTWTGCVNDRDQNFDTKNDAPGTGNTTPSSKYYAEQWGSCLAAQVIPMSNSWSTLKQKIDDMVPAGNTNQAIGLAWGWQSLSTINGPILAPAKNQNYIYKDYIVLLSDGLNTQDRWSTTTTAIDTRQKLLCDAIQHDTTNPITVFTIQVNIANKDAKSLVLQNCATGGNSQMITTSNQTANAFQNIITQISKLRVAK